MARASARSGPDLRGLYRENTPAAFWRLLLEPPPSSAEWDTAVRAAAAHLPPAVTAAGLDLDTLLVNTLGEGQFGPGHWELGALKRAYYGVKPLVPRRLAVLLRRLYRASMTRSADLGWPIEPGYARFLWEVAQQIRNLRRQPALPFIHFWPEGHRYAFVITHDVETGEGQQLARELAELDASYGFHSSFNFVAEDYRLDLDLIEELRERGFEVGVHGVHHDGRAFCSRAEFLRQAQRINRHLKRLDAVGFRTPLTHRHPEWMQALDVEYDLSFFDTDPFEPLSGGTMSLWPFTIGRFLELPYTLVQDYTLTAILKETTPRIWLQKVDFISAYHGLALVNTHPDYLKVGQTRRVYESFLAAMRSRADFWNALPFEAARWWRARTTASSLAELPGAVAGVIGEDGNISVGPLEAVAS